MGKKSAGKRPGVKKQPAKRRVLNPPSKATATAGPRAVKPDRPDQWIIVTRFDSGDVAFWGTTRWGWSGLTPYRGNSHRYESENAALHVGYTLKESRALKDFHVERLPRPRRVLPPLPGPPITEAPEQQL